jgi:hypothetical protein
MSEDGKKIIDTEAEAGRSTALQNHPFAIAWRKLSYYWSSALLIFAIFVVIWGIAKQWNNSPWDPTTTHPVFEVFIFLLMMSWIALLEGCQISIVGLQNINIEAYKDSHPRAYAICKWAHKGPNVERFLVGRQFLLLFNGFLVSKVGGAKRTENFYIGDWEWNEEATQFFWSNSALLMIVIISPCQLVTQLIAADKMLGFLDLRYYGYYTVLAPCMIVETIGLTHSTYLLKDILTKLAGIDQSQADPKKQLKKDFFHWFRCLISVAAVIFSGIFIGKGLALSQTPATDGAGWNKLPGYAAVIVGCIFLFTMACAEGLQVSALALANTHTSEWRARAPLAYRTCQVLYAGRNMQAFLVGRQFMVAMMMVLLARVTSYSGEDGEIDGEDWGMGRGFNEGLLQTGFMGAIFVVNVAQLASQVTASIFPISFINNHLMNLLLKLMLLIEFSGVVNSCWPLARFVDSALGLEKDPFDADEDADTPAHNILDRKKSLGIPVTKGVSPFDLNQPEQEYHLEYTYRVSYV